MVDDLSKEPWTKSPGDSLVDRLIAEIEANIINDQFGVDSLAQAVGMSRSSLHRKLHKLRGVSTSQFIREYRLNRAMEMLKHEDLIVSEVAYRVGFSSATYFNTCFHKLYGFPPGEVKTKIANGIGNLEPLSESMSRKTIAMASQISERNNVVIHRRFFWLGVFGVLSFSILFYYFNILGQDGGNVSLKNTVSLKSIAVLPLKNWTGNDDLEYVSYGMTDAVISGLSKVSAFDKVTPFSSTIKYQTTKKSADEISKELEVANLLTGSVQISGDHIKINLQLLDAGLDKLLWSEEFTSVWNVDEIFKIQSEVVERVASKMNVFISDSELKDIQKIPTQNQEAYTYYLHGEFQRNKANKLTYSNAISLYEKAIALDSNFVEAYVGLANIWSFGGLVWGIYDQQYAWDNAKKLLLIAFEIDSSHEGVQEELYTGYFYYDWDFKLVEEYYQRKLTSLFFDNTPAIMVDYPIKTGRYKEAILAADKHISIDPTVGIYFLFKAEALMLLNKTVEAKKIMANVDSLYSDNWFFLRESTKLYYYLEDYESSKKQLNKLLKQYPDYPPILVWFNAVYAHMDGEKEDSRQFLGELYQRYRDGSSGSPAWFIALHFCILEDYGQALDWLEKSFVRHEVELTWLREEPILTPIRHHPRYIELYDKVGFSSIGLPIKATKD
ncbi:helix-turn-helix domain-containing protein [uncultured Cyclobacterium sp.]|uniref:helix-turn-helix domain-containing protein n=1 Tax=uncultured Cyclobacterium sp. TaxID=453820 RepID=UPI0030EB72E9|tara:strand:+ start:20353 stop:22356 length:2004 start_codon:yes stop_codon:yes gene_type:complete